ncbi:MAG: response regulator [Bacteroidales bacterium]|nr:response regulator [Bacteroidales bacterium]
MIKQNQLTTLTWKRILISMLIIAAASLVRLIFFEGLGRGIAYLTFYPAVMIAAIAGGLYSGILATVVSAFLCYYWIQKGYMSSVEWMAFVVFLISCVMISVVAEAMRFANRKATEAEKKAQTANQAKSTFLANMSHELRTPMNAILGYSQLMQREAKISPEYSEYLSIINRSGEHLLALINEVLEISKIEAKKITLEQINFNFHNLIHDLNKMFELKANSKGLLLEFQDFEKISKYIIADETKLRIILTNLIGNAIKFTQKGKIDIRFSHQNESDNTQFLIVEINDTGPGIAEEEKVSLFKYFMQTESGKQSKSGTGLGLAISQDYAKMMGGGITATSTVGIGSTFTVRIKTKEGKEESVKSDLAWNRVIGLAQGQKNYRILVAEDIVENRKLIVTLLKLTGFDVQEAVNGKEAVEIAEQWNPDFIWMDIRMPVMDGLEATRIIKSSKAGKQIKIAALSAHVLSEEREEIFDAGCDDFLGKPFHEKELFKVMQKHLALEYNYIEINSNDENEIDSSKIAIDLSMLDDDIREELKTAVDSTDASKISRIAIKITNQEPLLAKNLQMCARNFNYEPIQKAFENYKNTKLL